MTYTERKERLQSLMGAIEKSKFNDEEYYMVYAIIGLSEDRNAFNKEYNQKIDSVLLDKKRRDK